MPSKEERLRKQNQIIKYMLFIPVVLLLAVVPFITRLRVMPLDEELASIYLTRTSYDFFSQYKSMAIIVLTGVMIALLFFVFQKEKMKTGKVLLTYYIAAGAFVLLTILSTVFSNYKKVAMWGVYDKAEGMVMMICYIFIMLYMIYALEETRDYRYLIISLSILVVLMSVLGVLQYIGQDPLFKTELGKKLIIPSQYSQLSDSLGSQYESGKVYGTMFHYNYMGSFGAMMVPLFAVMTLLIPGKKKKMGLFIVTIAAMFLLFGSTSRAGLIGLGLAMLVGIIMFGKKIIQKWKITIPVLVVFAVIVIGFNAVTGGKIFERIPTLVQDAFGIFAPADKSFDYKGHIPVRDVQMQDGKATLVTQGDSITVEKTSGGLMFSDAKGQEIEYVLNDKTYETQDERFSNIRFIAGEMAKTADGKVIEGFLVQVGAEKALAFTVTKEKGICLVNNQTLEPLEIQYPKTFGFEGKERLGSARGYIWSRSLPMLKDTILLGYGPDAYVMAFPQNDLFGKWYAYETPNMVISKPHNLYLQIALNEGIIALIAFLVIVVGYIVWSLKLYALRSYYSNRKAIGVANMLAVVGYLGAGLFNDSVISVAPIFWVLLGAGLAINYIEAKESQLLGN